MNFYRNRFLDQSRLVDPPQRVRSPWTSWRALEDIHPILNLVKSANPDPDVADEGTLVSSLSYFATALPRLRFPGLFFDRVEPPSSAGDLFSESQLSLSALDVGGSPVAGGDPLPVGLDLASLFAVGTRPRPEYQTFDMRDIRMHLRTVAL